MRVRITDYTDKLIGQTNQNISVFLRIFSEEVIRVSTPSTPMKTGTLRRNIFKEVLGRKAKIKWKQDYATYQEEIQHKNYTTPGTGPHFAKDAIYKTLSKVDSIIKQNLT